MAAFFPLRSLGFGILSTLLFSGCCCMDCFDCGCKPCRNAVDVGWRGGSRGCGCSSCSSGRGGCSYTPGFGDFSAASGWCPDYPAMAAGWTQCGGPIIGFFGALRNGLASGGCGCGCAYYDEWINDPPACHDPCPDAYGCGSSCGCGNCNSCQSSGAESFGPETYMENMGGVNVVPSGAASGGCNCSGHASQVRSYRPGGGPPPRQVQATRHGNPRGVQSKQVRPVSHQAAPQPQPAKYQYSQPRTAQNRQNPTSAERRNSTEKWDW